MRAGLLGVLLLAACQRAPPPPAVDAGMPRPRVAPVPVQLPSRFDGYVALRPDDGALAQGSASNGAGAVVVRVTDRSGKELFTAALDTPSEVQKARSYLVREGFRPLTEHPADAYVEAEVKVALEGETITVELGKVRLAARPPLPPSKDAQVELAGWSQDGKVLVVRMRTRRGESGAATGYVIVPVPSP